MLEKPPPPAFDAEPWVEDYLQLRDHLERAYANLLTAQARGLDLAALNDRTLAALRQATSDTEARWALGRFIAAFGDPHLRIELPEAAQRAQASFRLIHDHGVVRLRTNAGPGCSLVAGDEIRTIAGTSIGALVASYETIVASRSAWVRHDQALRELVAGPLALPLPLQLEGMHEGQAVACTLEAGEAAVAVPEPASAAELVCRELGYDRKDPLAFLDWRPLPELSALPDDNPFFAGILSTPGATRVGVLRIPAFGEDQYLGACVEVCRALASERGAGACTAADHGAVAAAVRKRLTAAIAERLTQLERAGVHELLLDVTHNGGGSGWAATVARMLQPGPLPCSDFGMIKHEHWRTQVAESLEILHADLTRRDLSPAERELLVEDERRLERAKTALGAECDLRAVWTASMAAPSCSNVVRTPSLACAPWLASPRSGYLSRSDEERPRTRFTGRLTILVDGFSASATEQLVAGLKDAGTARVMGQTSYGAGCGYTAGGVSITLRHSGLVVRAPDCIRFRRDGTNEALGIEPDVVIDWVPAEDPVARARKVIEALGVSQPSTPARR
jgi:hypothetical protein